MSAPRIQSDDALIVVDVQKDFCSGGALPIQSGDDVVPVLNEWIEAASTCGARVVFSRDWHPADHASFQEQGGPWPQHCVQNTQGAEFHAQLKVPRSTQIVSKGTARTADNYSAFDGTNLAAQLECQAVRRVWIGGLAQDICVRATVLDACQLGFEVHLIADATRPVDKEQGRKALEEMRAVGAIIERGDTR